MLLDCEEVYIFGSITCQEYRVNLDRMMRPSHKTKYKRVTQGAVTSRLVVPELLTVRLETPIEPNNS